MTALQARSTKMIGNFFEYILSVNTVINKKTDVESHIQTQPQANICFELKKNKILNS